MPLIKSISGIRGTIGGTSGNGLTPNDVVKFTAAFAVWVNNVTGNKKIVVGRDGRISGMMIRDLVVSTLISLGFTVVDIGLSTTPTVEIAVPVERAGGGIIITASHNPKEWNALKLLNSDGEFIDAKAGEWILEYAQKNECVYSDIDALGTVVYDDSYIDTHINAILAYRLVDREAIKSKKFKIVVDVINSTGGIAVPRLLHALGVSDVIIINKEITGNFAHNPEPIPEHLSEISSAVKINHASLGIVVDPDVDRLCFVCEDGTFFGEEYTLVAVADYVLSRKSGNTVSNLSSTQALKDITEARGGKYFASSVGEVNVVETMKKCGAIIGGEGNGGVIVPEIHYGRDALVGIALFLTHLAKSEKTISQLRKTYPNYVIAKNKITVTPEMDVSRLFQSLQKKYEHLPINTEDGLRIQFDTGWVHIRTSNTEPIIRMYSESKTAEKAYELYLTIQKDVSIIQASQVE